MPGDRNPAANDVYNNESGKRLFPLVAFGGNLGSFVGAGIADSLLVYLNEFELLLVAAAMLGACIRITSMISRRVWGRSGMRQRQQELSQKLQRARVPDTPKEDLGFALLQRHRYVALIAGSVLMLNLVNTTGGYILDKLVLGRGQEEVEQVAAQAVAAGTPLTFGIRELGSPDDEQARLAYQRSWIASFSARFFLFVNLLAFFLQVVDSFFQRFGDVASAVVVFVGTQVFILGTGGFALVNVAFVLLWFGLVAGIAREHRELEAGNRPEISGEG